MRKDVDKKDPTDILDKSEYFTIDDICERLSIGRVTAFRLIKVKGFPCIRVNRCLRINKEQFYQWLVDNNGKTIELPSRNISSRLP